MCDFWDEQERKGGLKAMQLCVKLKKGSILLAGFIIAIVTLNRTSRDWGNYKGKNNKCFLEYGLFHLDLRETRGIPVRILNKGHLLESNNMSHL